MTKVFAYFTNLFSGHLRGTDITRLGILIGVVVLLFWLDTWLPTRTGEAALSPLLTSGAFVLGLAALSHLTRRVLFPKLDIQEIAQRACETSAGASVVFLGVVLVLAVLIAANVAMVR